ncbi:5-formyltetrahydrofolate cyclo-ligase [Parapedobacter tibetensis]|uniref:5-formyltetrahydrofolate cyclo-ligase n=1 Tax=Parapedobacter tibetensis TaxID=2972951 RepID=UPI00214D3600|nr:5-formyltetrahydrofolate cyclo-ligase [Parapedobacter tibetensis]
MQHTKYELRKIYREKRMNLAIEQFHSLNQQLMQQVKQLSLKPYLTIHLFLPITGNHEPDTHAIAGWLRKTNPRIRIAIAKSNDETSGMHHFIWDADTVLKENHWGIPEPENGIPVSTNEIDAIFVPLLAFDKLGNRVGYGGGFYDRFLAECRADTIKIGLSLFDAIDIISDTNQYDIALDACVTPYRIWYFNTTP